MEHLQLNGREIQSEAQLHHLLSTAFSFPAYYGNNLDALYDCLTESTTERSLQLTNFASLQQTLGDRATTILSLLEAVATECPSFHFSIIA